ncbi:MAG: hypothetical protein GX425_16175 [Peptococcaceae bacterium]|nr:hypothetical protein [Peptococcaceae bacterium]
MKDVIPMATVSFDKNIVVKEPEAIERLVEVLSSSKEAKPINRKLASDEAMARGEKLLKQCLSHSKRF